MKYFLISLILMIGCLNQVHAQLALSVNYTHSKDEFFKGRFSTGLEIGYYTKITKKIAFYTGLESKYLFKYKTKTAFYSAYEIEDLDPSIIWIIERERFLDREHLHNSTLIIPKIHLMYDLNLDSRKINISLYTGINTTIKIFDSYFWSYAFYSEDLTKISFGNDKEIIKKISLYNVYIPLGFQLKLGKTPIMLVSSYDIRLKKDDFNVPWNWGQDLHNIINVGLGYQF